MIRITWRKRPGLLGEAADAARRWILEPFAGAIDRGVAALVGGGLFAGAAVFLLVAGAEGLKAARLPPYAAYLAAGTAGLAAGCLLLCRR